MIKRKVLHIVENLEVGGLERVLASIVLNLDRSKFIPKVWCLAKGGEIADDLIRKGLSVEVLGLISYYNPVNIVKLSNYLRRSKIDIIHTHGYFASTFGRSAAILAGTPVIITHIHTSYYGFKKRNILLERFLSCFTDKIICVSKSTKEFVEQIERINPNKTCLIYNGADKETRDTVKFHIKRESFAFSANDFVLITVASLVPQKGHQILLDAVKILSKDFKTLRLLIVGEGPLRSKLETYAQNLQISTRIVFTGLRSDVRPLLNLADLFVLASTEREGLSIALIEAMAQGLALVGTRIGGTPEVIENNVNGLLVAPGDPHEMANVISGLIADKGKRDMMGNQGRKIFENKFSTQIMTEKIESLYGGLTSWA